MSGKQGFLSRLDGPLDAITYHLKQGWLARIILIILIVGSTGAIWWSINERLALIYGARSIQQQQAKIQLDIDRLQMQWSSQNHEKIAADLLVAETRLMPDQSTLADWLSGFITAAQNQQIKLVYNVGRARPSTQKLGNIQLIPVQIILRPSDRLKQADAYKKILDFARNITDNRWRMDVSTASVSGNGSEFEQLEIHIEMWMLNKAAQPSSSIQAAGSLA